VLQAQSAKAPKIASVEILMIVRVLFLMAGKRPRLRRSSRMSPRSPVALCSQIKGPKARRLQRHKYMSPPVLQGEADSAQTCPCIFLASR
jgi:hypothetical protein